MLDIAMRLYFSLVVILQHILDQNVVLSGGDGCGMTCRQDVGQHYYFEVLFDVTRSQCVRSCCQNVDCVVFDYNKLTKGKINSKSH